MNDNRVLILAGIRRCGKSTLLKQPMQDAVIFFPDDSDPGITIAHRTFFSGQVIRFRWKGR